MLLFLVTCVSCIFFLNPFPLKQLPLWTNNNDHMMRLLQLCFWKDLSFSSSPICKSIKKGIFVAMKKELISSSKLDHVDENDQFISLLDLPELTLDCILEKLSPTGLRTMSGVCTSLRDRCLSDHLWERHMKHKWGHVLSPKAYREWQCFIASRQALSNLARKKSQGFIKYFGDLLPLSWFASKYDKLSKVTIMSLYLALESGKFWFPAQIYNRENGHVGFMLSCYDAEFSYDSQNDTFHTRYPPHGRRTVPIESGVQWERLRVAPVETSSHELHVSDCLIDLHPGDHIEIQWRRNKEFPYGWWYGVIGHLETCDSNINYCHCFNCDTVVLEFNQYTMGSRWRRTTVNRKDHREEGNESDGFYGGIRKLYHNDEIATWKRLWSLWPKEIME